MDNKLIFPQDGDEAELQAFCTRVIELIDCCYWVVAILYPPPFDEYSNDIEKECAGLLTRLKIPYNGLGWLVARTDLIKVLPTMFGSLAAELILLAFDEVPDPEDVYRAWNSMNATPAMKILFFDWSELVEVRVSEK